MSGRVRTTLADGRRVTGYRKTLRRNERTKPEDRPELRFTFTLPYPIALLTLAGEYAGGATVDIDGMVTVRGQDRDWVLRKAAEFLQGIARDLTWEPITATLFCPSYPGPTRSSPVRPGYSDGYEITIATSKPAVVIARTSIKPVVVA